MTTTSERPRRARSRLSWTLAALAVAALAAVLSLAVGARPVPLPTVLQALLGQLDATSPDAVAVVGLRIPRTVAGLVAGAALGAAGVIASAVTRNPLADPGVLGVTAGSGFAIAIGVGFLGVGTATGYVALALIGALLASVLVAVLGGIGRGSAGAVRVTLAGLAFGAVLLGITNGLVLADARRFDALRTWEAGVLSDRDWAGILPGLPVIALGLALAAAPSRALDALAIGEDHAASVGVRVGPTRVVALLAITLLAGGATAIAGPIAFVGLMVAHIARRLVGPSHGWLVALSAFLGGALLVLADVLGRVIAPPGELAAGIVVAALGAPVLIAIVRRPRMALA